MEHKNQLIGMQKEYYSPFIVLNRITRIMQSKFLQGIYLFNNKTLFFLLKKNYRDIQFIKRDSPTNFFSMLFPLSYSGENLIISRIQQSVLNYTAFYSAFLHTEKDTHDPSHTLNTEPEIKLQPEKLTPLRIRFIPRHFKLRPSKLLVLIPFFFVGQIILGEWETHSMISYNKIKNKTPLSFNDIDFEELEKTLKIRIDDFSRESIRRSDNLRRILAFRKFDSLHKNTDLMPLELFEKQ